MASPTVQTVCIVDDDAQVRRFLVEMLASIGISAEEYPSGEDFMRRWRPGGTSCVLLDIRMPRVTGPEVHDWLRERSPEIPVIFLSGYADVPTAVRAMRQGAFDFLEKPFNVQQLIERVNAALRLADARRAAAAAATPAPDDWRQSLTPREHEVLRLISKGMTLTETARLLQLSRHTVDGYVKEIYRKLNVSSRAEAALTAHNFGLV